MRWGHQVLINTTSSVDIYVASPSDDSSLTDPWIGITLENVAHRAGVKRFIPMRRLPLRLQLLKESSWTRSLQSKGRIRPGTNLANLAKLKPVFRKDRLTTVGTHQQSF
ncbi:hypothetical protein Tco_1087462, partial [Tanacetum coccineum]